MTGGVGGGSKEATGMGGFKGVGTGDGARGGRVGAALNGSHVFWGGGGGVTGLAGGMGGKFSGEAGGRVSVTNTGRSDGGKVTGGGSGVTEALSRGFCVGVWGLKASQGFAGGLGFGPPEELWAV